MIFTLDEQFPNARWENFTPGEQMDRHYFTQPEAPSLAAANAPMQAADGSESFDHPICLACRTADGIDLQIQPFGGVDTNGFLDPTDSASYTVYGDDVPVQSGSLGSTGGVLSTSATMPPAASTYRIDYNVTRNPSQNTLSTFTRISWQIRPQPRRHRRRTGPVTVSTGPRPYRCSPPPCSCQRTVTAGWHRAPGAGDLTLGHVGRRGAPNITTLKVQISYDVGAHWGTVPAALDGSGHYALKLAVPAALPAALPAAYCASMN